MSAVVIWHFGGGVMYPEKTEAKTRGRVERGINAQRAFIRKQYKVDYRVRRSATEGVRVSVNPVVINGIDYRGVARNRTTIELHNGWIASRGKWYDLFPEAQGLGQIWTHEWLHVAGLGHSGDPSDIMHSNAPPTLTTTLPWMLRKFGRIKLKSRSQQENQEIETVLRATRSGLHCCFAGAVEF